MTTSNPSPHEALSRFPRSDSDVKTCEFCDGPLRAQGTRTKRFCRDLCRTRFHYARRLARQATLHQRLRVAGMAIEAAQSVADGPSTQTEGTGPRTDSSQS